MTRRYKFIIRWSVAIISAVALIILICDVVVTVKANGKCYDTTSEIPYNKYGLLLGTSPITPQGEHNYYFDNRIKATAELYHNGKIKRIIASGGNQLYTDGCTRVQPYNRGISLNQQHWSGLD